ncbi:MAG: hypothetical protein ACREBJ_10745 [Nitrosotalea sp.]
MNLEETVKECNDLYDILKLQDLFVKSNLIERWGAQTFRNLIQFNNLNRRVKIAEKNLPDYLAWYKKNIPENPMDESQFTLESITLLCYQGLSIFEHFKRFLLLTMDLQKLNKLVKGKLTNHSTIGSLIEAITKLPDVNKKIVNELFDIDFRNSFAHDSWYIEEEYWKYVKPDGESIILKFDELARKVKSLHANASIIILRYNQDNFPQIVEMYNELNKKFKNTLLPTS